jgi:hypothetical protein
MNDTTKTLLAATLAGVLTLNGCTKEPSQPSTAPQAGDHGHEDGEHADHNHAGEDHDAHMEDDHADAFSLGTVRAGDLEIELSQGHGEIAPGKELHLTVKLPYSDAGATVVRAWLGTEDRYASVVAKAEYAPAHDDYDVHALAPEPLPENTMWWVEIERPDGTKLLASVAPH